MLQMEPRQNITVAFLCIWSLCYVERNIKKLRGGLREN